MLYVDRAEDNAFSLIRPRPSTRFSAFEGHEINNSLSPYPTVATYQIWFRLAM